MTGVYAETQIEDFKFNEVGLQELMKGPVLRDLTRRAILVQNAAKNYATGNGGGPNVRTGTLRRSITWWPGIDSLSPYVDIGTSVSYAPFVEFGHSNTYHVYPIYTGGGTFAGIGVVSNRPTRAFPFLRPALKAAYASF